MAKSKRNATVVEIFEVDYHDGPGWCVCINGKFVAVAVRPDKAEALTRAATALVNAAGSMVCGGEESYD